MERASDGIVLILALAAITAPPASAAEPRAEHARYALSAEIRPQSPSEDARYRINAEVRRTQAQSSTDGRYALKAVRVPDASCSALTDLFADGFEGN